MRPRLAAALGLGALFGLFAVAGGIETANATTCSYKPWADAHPELCSPTTTTVPPTLPPLTTAPATTVPATTTTNDLIPCPGWNPPKSVPPGTPCGTQPTPPSTVTLPVKPPCHPVPGSQDQYCDAPTTAPTVAPVADSPVPTALPTPGPARSAPPATVSVVALHNLPTTGNGDVLPWIAIVGGICLLAGVGVYLWTWKPKGS